MKRRAFSIGAGFLMAAGLALPASAAEVCAGTQALVFVCVDPVGDTIYTDCVYVGPPPCVTVTVPGPSVSCGGSSPYAPGCSR